MSTLLLFNLTPRKRSALQIIALRCGCRVKPVPPEQTGATLSELLAGENAVWPSPESAVGEMLVMADLSERQMDLVLTQLRRNKVEIPLKAVLTPTNADWTAAALYKELCRERDAFAAGRREHE